MRLEEKYAILSHYGHKLRNFFKLIQSPLKKSKVKMQQTNE